MQPLLRGSWRGRGGRRRRRGGGADWPARRREAGSFPQCPAAASAAADGCCGKVLPFAWRLGERLAEGGPAPAATEAARRLALPSGACGRPAPFACLSWPLGRCPFSTAMNPPAAAGEEKGAAGGGGGGSACRGAEGGGEPRGSGAAAGELEEPALAGQKEESLEEKLKSLTFRKQVSYRCVARARGEGGLPLAPGETRAVLANWEVLRKNPCSGPPRLPV